MKNSLQRRLRELFGGSLFTVQDAMAATERSKTRIIQTLQLMMAHGMVEREAYYDEARNRHSYKYQITGDGEPTEATYRYLDALRAKHFPQGLYTP